MQTAFPLTQLQNGVRLWMEGSLKSVVLSKFAIFLRLVYVVEKFMLRYFPHPSSET